MGHFQIMSSNARRDSPINLRTNLNENLENFHLDRGRGKA